MKGSLPVGLIVGTFTAATLHAIALKGENIAERDVASAVVDVPVPMVWQFDDKSLVRKQYLRDIDFISENTLVDLLAVAPVGRVNPEDPDQFHDAFKELVEYANSKGIRTVLRSEPNMKGFFNASVDGGDGGTYIIENQGEAQGIAYESESKLDSSGFAIVSERGGWGRNKLRPLRNELLAVYAFNRSGDGFYRPGSLVDITDKARVVARTSAEQTIEIEAGAAFADKTIYVLTVQYYNAYDCFGGSNFRFQTKIMDALADVPLAGYYMDETGYMSLNTSGISSGKVPPWRGRFYSKAQADWWAENRRTDLKRLLFDMRYAPEGNDGVRIRAINAYMDVMRRQPCEIERLIVGHQQKLWGKDVFLACHSTFHNRIDCDEVWHTGCDWWDVPRDFAFTDENIDFPTRMGVLLGAKYPFLLHMYYSKNAEDYYRTIVGLLPFNGREFHHAYNDDVWGKGFKDDDRTFLENIRKFDAVAKRLNAFQAKSIPRIDLLIVFGTAAQFNWYPDAKARSRWDIDGSLHVQDKADSLWRDGYRCALVPDTKISDGVLQFRDGLFVYNGHKVRHCVYLYPKYAKKDVYAFLNAAAKAQASLVVIGRADIDFDAEKAEFCGRNYAEWSSSVVGEMNVSKSAIPGGALAEDGSFVLVSRGIIDDKPTDFDFTVNGVRYTGRHTGYLAYRRGEPILSAPGSELKVAGDCNDAKCQ